MNDTIGLKLVIDGVDLASNFASGCEIAGAELSLVRKYISAVSHNLEAADCDKLRYVAKLLNDTAEQMRMEGLDFTAAEVEGAPLGWSVIWIQRT